MRETVTLKYNIFSMPNISATVVQFLSFKTSNTQKYEIFLYKYKQNLHTRFRMTCAVTRNNIFRGAGEGQTWGIWTGDDDLCVHFIATTCKTISDLRRFGHVPQTVHQFRVDLIQLDQMEM